MPAGCAFDARAAPPATPPDRCIVRAMFDTGPILWLQSFSSDGLTLVLRAVTATGYTSVYVPLIVAITLAIDFRRGFLLTQAMIWTATITGFVKNLACLPRPTDVDPAVRMLAGSAADGPYGLPSGHVSGALVLWTLIAMLFPRRPLVVLAGAMAVLMPLSRLYLGRHFPADVLAGLGIGAAVLLVVRALVLAPRAPVGLLRAGRVPLGTDPASLWSLAYAVLVPLALLAAAPLTSPQNAGRLLGLTTGFLLLAAGGLPEEGGSLSRRIARALIGMLLYAAADKGFAAAATAAGLDPESHAAVAFAGAALATFVMLLGGASASLALRLYPSRAR